MRIRSRSLLLLALFVAAAGAAAPLHAQRVKTIKETVALDRDGVVVVDTYKGSITISTWDRDEVAIDVRIEADDSAKLVPDTEVHIRSTDRRLVLETDYDEAQRKHRRWGFKSLSLPLVHYTLKVPRTAEVRIDDYKSETEISGLTADLHVETYKGKVDVRDHTGAILLETYKGEVRADFTRMTGDSAFDTYKGDIEIRLPDGDGYRLDADLSRRGDLDTDFLMQALQRRDDRVRGDVNGGGPRLHLETYKGTFRLRTH